MLPTEPNQHSPPLHQFVCSPFPCHRHYPIRVRFTNSHTPMLAGRPVCPPSPQPPLLYPYRGPCLGQCSFPSLPHPRSLPSVHPYPPSAPPSLAVRGSTRVPSPWSGFTVHPAQNAQMTALGFSDFFGPQIYAYLIKQLWAERHWNIRSPVVASGKDRFGSLMFGSKTALAGVGFHNRIPPPPHSILRMVIR